MSQSDPIKETNTSGSTGGGNGGPVPDTASKTSPADQPAGDSAAVAQPFFDAHTAYCHEVNKIWQADREAAENTWCAHVRAYEALMNELKRGVSNAERRYHEGMQAASQSAAEEQRNAAASAFSRYHTEVNAAQTAAAQKWQAHTGKLKTTIDELQQSHAQRGGAAYQGYLDALKSAWRSVDVEKLPTGVLEYISSVLIHAARFA